MQEDQKQYDVSPGRKVLFYGGMGIQAIGVLLFLSMFVSAFMGGWDSSPPSGVGSYQDLLQHLQNHSLPEHPSFSPPSFFVRGIIGFVMILVGGMMQNIGKRGLAGSGLVIDPKQERQDMEPWNRMSGGMAQDGLEEVAVVRKLEKHLDRAADGSGVKEVVKVRCRGCKTLNDEDAKFCDQCGASMAG